jgi:DNA-binding NarL/FixJ family response regulator
MDLRALVLTKDASLGDVLRTQVENLGGACTLRETYDELGPSLAWADAAVIDLAGDGLDDLNRLRVECPRMRVLAVATDEAQAESAQSAGADHVLSEPFSIADIVDSIRRLAPPASPTVIDLVTGEMTSAPAPVEGPWFATS